MKPWALVQLALAAFSAALLFRACILIFFIPEEARAEVVQAHWWTPPDLLPRQPLPPFPELAPEERPPEPSEPDAGTPFRSWEGRLAGVTWIPAAPWDSIVSLTWEKNGDEFFGVFSLCDCDGLSPCWEISPDYRLIRVARDEVEILHVPSGMSQSVQLLWTEGDAGVRTEPLFNVRIRWHRHGE